MPIGPRGDNLIFLISQPRAGSTLLQRILGSHPEVHTASEPWIMLHPFYAARAEGIETEYRHQTARIGVDSFVDAMPGGRDDYDDGLRRMYAHLYTRATEGSGKSRFLDKTPRYYLIIPDLLRVFPRARFVLLFRNPLAVLASVLKTWAGQDPAILHTTRHDLQRAPALLLDGVQQLGDACIVVRYEELVADPNAVVEALCAGLGLEFHPPMIHYAQPSSDGQKWALGDQGTVNQQSRPFSGLANRWKDVLLQTPQWRNWARGYLRELGPDVVGAMGYDYGELSDALRGPARGRGVIWVNWNTAMKPPGEYGLGERLCAACGAAVRRSGELKTETRSSLRTRGLIGTIRRIIQLCWQCAGGRRD